MDTLILDMKPACTFVDYLVICTGESDRQVEAIRQAIVDKLREQGVGSCRREGDASSGWTVLDYGDVIIHIFGPAERDYYQLDRLWEKAIPVIRVQ